MASRKLNEIGKRQSDGNGFFRSATPDKTHAVLSRVVIDRSPDFYDEELVAMNTISFVTYYWRLICSR